MKLQQLKYIVEISRHNLNISATADALFTSQPGISKQVRALESELGITIFQRQGKQLIGITSAGNAIIKIAADILRQTQNIKNLSADYGSEDNGALTIATTHTQARHALPYAVTQLTKRYPKVTLHMHQGTPMQIAEMASKGEVDFCVATEAMELFENLVMLPCYRWNRCIVVPPDHPLLAKQTINIHDLAKYPLVTYVFGFTGRSKLDSAFQQVGLTPNVVFTATDSEVIKTYVKLGLGVGIVAKMAYNSEVDHGLVSIDAGHLFEASITNIAFRKGTILRRYMYDFIQWFAPHLDQKTIEEFASARSQQERTKMGSSIATQLIDK